ncbi:MULTISPECIES: DUF2798 domain-containing protein [Paenibacillus]|jgi:hypothetical protein|uniref:DUF2798 domain-containing protein n=1 Tax=Paenibacillus TaxID=44249 RepID=UPI00096F5173|nr:DUF2798 domain-containing protein [Paenibacillus odorifer]OMD73022.1 hypothetical protein BSK50_23540 [Paenibacillus odorifer]
MTKDNRLPHNSKEGAIYGIIICTLTVIFMTTFNIVLNSGTINLAIVTKILIAMPFIWIIAMFLQPIVVGPIVDKIVRKLTTPTDSFYPKILLNTLFTVLGMCALMTLIGTIIGNGFSKNILLTFLNTFPRNFLIVLFLECIIIQPIARWVMVKIHIAQERKSSITTNLL